MVRSASSFLARHTSRRGFLSRAAVVGTALVTHPWELFTRPVTAYAAVCGCAKGNQPCQCGSLCCDGYTEFCCTIYGTNTCPSGTVAGGWWKADGSGMCGGAARYYLDCNVLPGQHVCDCGCGVSDCNNRMACCVNFRYGQCHQEYPTLGPIACRVVTCTPPWQLDPSCTTSVAVDEYTAGHDAPCLHTLPISKPAMVATANGRFTQVAVAQARGNVVARTFNGSVWSSPIDLGGVASAEPAAVVNQNGVLFVFARGADQALYYRNGLGAAPWVSLGGVLASPPGAALLADGRVIVGARGADGAAHHRIFDGTGWSNWAPMGGQITEMGVAITSPYVNRFIAAAVAPDRAVWLRDVHLDNTPSPDWFRIGGTATSGPALVTTSPGVFDVFTRGADNALWINSFNGAVFYGWVSLGGNLTSAPDATIEPNGRVTVAARGADGAVWANSRTGGVWSGWYSTGRLP
jgi:hypothetical protein